MNQNNHNFLSEGEEVTIEKSESDNQSIQTDSPITTDRSQPTSSSSTQTTKDQSAELAELNQLFDELEEMIAEKKSQQQAQAQRVVARQANRQQEILQKRENINLNIPTEFDQVEPLPDDDNFLAELDEYIQLPSRARLINQLNTCMPAENTAEYTTINEHGNYYKVKLAMHLADVITQSGAAHSPTMYLASGLDIEFPLLLQSRHIIMVDPCFSQIDSVHRIVSKINQYDSYDPEVKQISPYHHHIKFRFNFGRDLETVNLDLFGKRYQEYQNFLPLGCILEYNSSLNHSLAKSDLITKLMTGGLIINNQPSPMREVHVGWLNRLSNTIDPDQIEDQNAQHLGLSTIRLPFIPFAVYQKQSSNPRLLNYSETLTAAK